MNICFVSVLWYRTVSVLIVITGVLLFIDQNTALPLTSINNDDYGDNYLDQYNSNLSGGRIINGTLVDDGEFPFAAAIVVDGGIYCGGTVITEDTIITAAHCLSRNVADYTVYLGHVSLLTPDHSYQFKVKKVITHPEYLSEKLINDIGVMKLSKKIDFNGKHKRVKQACLPVKPIAVVTEKCMALGWGTTEDGQPSTNLHKVVVPILDADYCAKKSNLFDKKTEICAGYRDGGMDACSGDSGGALVCPFQNNRTGVSVQGLVSYGKGCALPDHPGYYTKVEAFTQWLAGQV